MIYLDDMYRHAIGNYRGMKMSHMIADDEDELHEIARKIGMRRSWFQRDHYDIPIMRRDAAIALGAIPITYRQCGLMDAVRRQTGVLPPPDKAESIWKGLRGQKAKVTPEAQYA